MYTKNFDPARFEKIRYILEPLQNLSPGEKITISGFSREEKITTRWLLYDWMSHMGVKSLFRIKEIDDHLMVIRKAQEQGRITTSTILSSSCDKILQEMITTSDDPIDLLRAKLREKEITSDEFTLIIGKYLKLME
jgi:hypothetical protein